MYAIICNARKGRSMGIDTLALVDRSKSRRLWWTSDNANLILGYHKRSVAEFAVKRLKENNPRIVTFDYAARVVTQQSREIAAVEDELDHLECMDAMEFGWDGHKCWGPS